MRDFSELVSIDLIILRAVASKLDITTREIENAIHLSRVQTLRRLKQLEERGLILLKDGIPRKAYRYNLSSVVTPQEIEQLHQARLNVNRDAVAREALEIMLSGMRTMINQLESILR